MPSGIQSSHCSNSLLESVNQMGIQINEAAETAYTLKLFENEKEKKVDTQKCVNLNHKNSGIQDKNSGKSFVGKAIFAILTTFSSEL